MLEVKGVVTHEHWGGIHHIPLILSQNFLGKECSEYLFTGSSSHVATLVDGSNFVDWLKVAPEVRLGVPCVEKLGSQLPFYVRFVDVNSPLPVCVITNSVKTKPSHCHSKAAFIVAITELILLSGFLTKSEIIERLNHFDILPDVKAAFDELGLTGGLSFIQQIDNRFAEFLIYSVYNMYLTQYENNEISALDNLYWFMRSVKNKLEQSEALSSDLILLLIMKLHKLEPEDVIFVGSGCAFTVLHGCFLELASHSFETSLFVSKDNSKSKELLKQVDVTKCVLYPLPLDVLAPFSDGYKLKESNLELTRFKLNSGEMVTISNCEFPSFWVVTKGEVMFNTQQYYSYPGDGLYQRPKEFNTLSATMPSVAYRLTIDF